VYFSEEEYRLLKKYMDSIRPHLDPVSDQVFCRTSGESATVGEIAAFLHSAWVDFGSMVSLEVGDMTFTLIRKILEGSIQHDWLCVGSIQHDWLCVGSIQHDWLCVGSIQQDWLCVGSIQHDWLCVSSILAMCRQYTA
jgi:hypothetical protein